MGLWTKYRLRVERKHRRIRSLRKRRELECIVDRSLKTTPGDIFLFTTFRNEKPRLKFFLEYYRRLGVDHFFCVDNGSDDGGRELLENEPDVSLWTTDNSYKRANFGVDWLNGLQAKYAVGHWILVVDVDEFFVYPHCDARPLSALTGWLDSSSIKSFGTVLIDMYPRGKIEETFCAEGKNPMRATPFFDAGNYFAERNAKYQNLWIQGGVRQRVFFKDKPKMAPALNKIPLVKWAKGTVFVSSTHSILPRGLNLVYDEWGGQKACGCLMHTKFLSTFSGKAQEELERKEHYAASREYKEYATASEEMWTRFSTRYKDWKQLENLGLMSRGGWA